MGLVKVGLIARADDRGLGIMTWEFHRAMRPHATLVVREPGAEARGFLPHLDRYPDATVVTYDGGLPEAEVRAWLHGLDVVYSAETFYDDRLLDWARDAKVATVLHAMPEFYRGQLPTSVWAPTPWRADTLPADHRLVPVPVAGDRFPSPQLRALHVAGPLRVLHTAGHRAAADRNGTLQLLQALRRVREPVAVRMLTQDPSLPRYRAARHVQLTTEVGGRPNYWELYADADVLVLPRRYGGLCLPVQEAMAAGLAVVMPDCPPNDYWPTLRVGSAVHSTMATPAGSMPLHTTNVGALARQLDQLAADRQVLGAAQQAAADWAAAHSWGALAGTYRAELARAAETAARDF